MKTKIELSIPTSWKDVTLKQYLSLQSDLESYRDDEEAQFALSLHHLCGLDAGYIKSLSAESYNLLKNKLDEFNSPDTIELQRFITLNGVEYGFEPNLSKMSYGAYADISQWDTISIDKNWAKIMDILYRPIEKKHGKRYSIQAYTGEIDEEKWMGVDMEFHWGALFFFVHLQMDLLKGILKSLKGMELPPNIKSILVKSGEVIQQSLNSPMVSLKK
jgi:hypothetical protein